MADWEHDATTGAARRAALRIALIYAVIGIAWIVLSDSLLDLIAWDSADITRLQSIKGVGFVVGTAILLFVIARRAIGRIQDLEARRTADLRSARERLQVILDAVPTRVLWKDGDLRYEGCNRAFAREVGLTPDTVVGRTDRDLPWAAIADEIEREDREVMVTGVPVQDLERRVEWPGASPMWLLVSKVPLRATDGTVRGVLTAYNNITEMREAELAVRQLQKLQSLGEITGGVAHDFKNVLAVITANAALLLDELPEDAVTVRAMASDIARSAESAIVMIRKLLGLGRRGDVRTEPTDLGALVHDLAGLMHRALGAQYTIAVEVAPDTPLAEADPHVLEHVVINLLTNSRDALPGGGAINVRVTGVDVGDAPVAVRRLPGRAMIGGPQTRPGRFVAVSVRDRGTGIPGDVLERMFELFHTTKAPGQGTGLGLRMVAELTRRQAGFFEIRSDGTSGTDATVYLPIARERPAAAQTYAGSADALPRGDETILVVEDQPALQSTAGRVLKRFGYRVVTADSGPEALRQLGPAHAVDLVLSDFQMPGMTGLELLAEVRRRGLTVPFMLTTGAEELSERGRGIDELTVPFLAKPWSIDELVLGVRAALDRSEGDVKAAGRPSVDRPQTG